MVLAVGQNSVWQHTYHFPRVVRGEVNRTTRNFASAAGKGGNVARALQHFGIDAWLLAYVGGPNGDKFQLACDRDGIRGDFVPIARETRVCTTLIEDDGCVTEIVEPAPEVSPAEREEYFAAFRSRLPEAALLAISGTAVQGETEDVYRRMVADAHSQGIPTILDSYKYHGRLALEAGPEVLKINLDELAELSGMAVRNRNDRRSAYSKLAGRYGLKWIAITMGSSGAEGYDGRRCYNVSVPAVKAVNPIGSGDSFTAGLIGGLIRSGMNYDSALPDALKMAAAAGTANCLTVKPGEIVEGKYQSVIERVTVSPA